MPIEIHIFEAHGNAGAEVAHSEKQPSSSYLNRCADQISFAADESNGSAKNLLPKNLRPTFLEWCKSQYQQTRNLEFQLRSNDVPPRRLHGMALRDCFNRYRFLLNQLPNVKVAVQVLEIVNVQRAGNQYFWLDAIIQ